MTVINTADKIYVGSSLASKVYSGTNLVWPSGPALDTSTAAWVAAVVAAGGSVSGSATSGRKKLVDDLIVGLKADGIWAKLDRLWLLAAENNQSARIDLVALDVASTTTSPAAPTFTADRGYAGNGSNAWLDTTFNPTTQGTNYVLNSAHLSVWDNTSRAYATTVQTGTNDGAAQADMFVYTAAFGGTGIGFRVNDAGAARVDGLSSLGFFLGQRINSTTLEAYYNGSFRVTYSQASTQMNSQGSTFYIGARCDGPSGSGSGVLANTDQISMASYGGKLTATENITYHNRLRTYMIAVGVIALDSATTAWAAAVVTAGGTVSDTRKKLVDDLIAGLKADGVWTKLDRLYLLAAENTQSALIDLIALTQATAISAPTFTVDQGYTTDGTKTVGLNYNPTTDAVQLSQDNCHLGAWNLFNGTNSSQLISDIPGASFMLYPKFADNSTYTRINDAGGGIAIGDPRGWIVGDRNNLANRDTYFNGTSLGNVTVTSVALHNAVTIQFVGGPCAAVSLGGSLTSTNHTALYNRLRTYMTGVGIP